MSGFKSLKDGQRVQYEPAKGKKGMEATKVTLA
jgi:cold shock CspA family protein